MFGRKRRRIIKRITVLSTRTRRQIVKCTFAFINENINAKSANNTQTLSIKEKKAAAAERYCCFDRFDRAVEDACIIENTSAVCLLNLFVSFFVSLFADFETISLLFLLFFIALPFGLFLFSSNFPRFVQLSFALVCCHLRIFVRTLFLQTYYKLRLSTSYADTIFIYSSIRVSTKFYELIYRPFIYEMPLVVDAHSEYVYTVQCMFTKTFPNKVHP